jgi:hypothetical protein
MSLRSLFPSCLIAVLAMGCAARGPAPKAAQKPPPSQVTLPRTVVTPTDAATIPELYERAKARLAAGDAARRPPSSIGSTRSTNRPARADALYGGARPPSRPGSQGRRRALRALGAPFSRACVRARRAARSIRLFAYLGAGEKPRTQASVCTLPDLRPIESIVALGAKALLLVSLGEAEKATFQIEKARTIVEEHRLDAAGSIPRALAQLYFALGEARRLRGESIRFDPVPDNIAQTLEERCQLLLDAQSLSDAMRAYDAHWSAMAGYRVGELYRSCTRT